MLMIWGYDMRFQLLESIFISYLALSFGYYVKKKHRGSYAYFAESRNCLFSSSTKWVIDSGASDHMTDKEGHGRGRKCDGLYVFEPEVSKSLVGLSSSSPFEAHCRLGHPSLQSVHLSPRANKRAASPFELVHSDVWGPCLVTSKSLVSSILSPLLMTTFVLLALSNEEPIRTQNGVAERKNRHLLEIARAFLFQMTVPKPFWADGVSTACFLINRMPSAVLGGSYPYSVLFPTKPLFPIDPRIFGSTFFVQDTKPNITKLNPKSLKCVFLGYSRIQKGTDGPPLKVYSRRPRITSDLVREPCSQLKDSPIDLPNDAPNNVSNDVPTLSEAYSDSDAPSGSDSPPASPARELDLPIALRKAKHTCTYPVSSFVSYDGLSPSSRAFVAKLESISVPKTIHKALAHSGWRAAMIEEMNALDHNAKGYAQTYGIDYKTFSPVAKISSIRLFISLAATYDWALHQLDVKNAFLHGDLQEEVYVEQHPGFVAQGEWNLRECVNLRKLCCILLVVYVDDIVIMGSDNVGIKKLKSFIEEICLDLLDDAGQIEAKPCDEPMVPKLKLKSEDGRWLQNPKKYRRVVRKLNYLTITRPNIAFPVSVVRQFRHIRITEGFTDVDYAGCPDTSPSTTGYCVFVGGNLVSWKSKKHDVVARSSLEAEYRAIAQTTCELAWLRNLLGEIGFP
uniref:Polyprotein, putative n=1 Tax=Tanacetum cinerariifolium TaxID=118510 RepID=A0A6L2KR58_TANCI|nr:polyprotein, putative [Tanacetum cinerariifolium]